MKTFGLTLSKVLIILATLLVTVGLSIFPLFNWGLPLKNNIAVVITLLVNQNPLTSNLYKQLMSNNNIIGCLASTLILFNLTNLVPLIFVKKPFSKAILAICMFLMTIVLTVLVLLFYNVFNLTHFQSISFNNLWIILIAALGLSFLTIFWYGLQNLWVNPYQGLTHHTIISSLKNNETIDEEVNYEYFKSQIQQLKAQLKEIRYNKSQKIKK